jgi:hypothetical protein
MAASRRFGVFLGRLGAGRISHGEAETAIEASQCDGHPETPESVPSYP